MILTRRLVLTSGWLAYFKIMSESKIANETVSIVIKAFDQTQKALRGIKPPLPNFLKFSTLKQP